MAPPRDVRRLAAILAADVVGYSRLVERDEAGTLRRLKVYRKEFIELLVVEYGGRVVKLMGDGILCEFPSVVDAVQCAVEIQTGMAQRETDTAKNQKIRFRIGINLGDVVHEEGDLYGDGVNIAARLEQLADPGGIAVSGAAHDHLRGKLGCGFEDLGDQRVKNIERPVRVYRVLLDGQAPVQVRNRVPRKIRPVLAAALALLLLGAGTGTWWWHQSQAPPSSAPKLNAPLLPAEPSVAVLPFANMSGDPGQEYFSNGITEDLITNLAKVSGLAVVARNAVVRYQGKEVTPQEVGREVGARYVVEGSVRKEGGQVRITAQLIDANTGYHLWAERYDRDLSDIFTLQDEITEQIATALQVKLAARDWEQLTSRYTPDIEAYELYLLGTEIYKRKSRENLEQARKLFERAIAIDPNFAAAYARLSHTYMHAWDVGWAGPDGLERAIELARKAVTLNDASPEAHEQLGFMYLRKKQYDQAISEVQRSIEIDPDYARGYARLGEVLANVGRPAETIALVEKARQLEPTLNFWYQWILAVAYHGLGQYEAAMTAIKECLLRDPDFSPAHIYLTAIYGELGRTGEAHTQAKEVLRLDPKFSIKDYISRETLKDTSVLQRVMSGLQKAGLPS